MLPSEVRRRGGQAPTAFDGVSIVGYLQTPSGLGESARRQYRAFREVGYKVAAYSVPLRNTASFPFDEVAPEPVARYSDAIVHINPPELLFAGSGLNYLRRGRNYVIAYWHWELPVFPPAWARAIDLVDEIWVPTKFCAEVHGFARKPVRIVPHAVPLNDIPQDEARRALDLPDDRFIFLSIFDTGSFASRKNPEAAVRAFMDAFDRETDSTPLFVVKLHGANRTAEFEATLRRMHRHPLIRIIDTTLDDDAMRHLQAACDCFVSLHRSEGFGFNMAECMAAGRAVIATDYSGNRDFMNRSNSIPIPYAPRPLARGEYLEGDGQWWAEPDHEAAVEAMRRVAADPAAAADLGRAAKSYMAANHSFAGIGRRAVAALHRDRAKAHGRYPRPAARPASAAPAARAPRIGRNDPCPCGSGRKYKNCHGAST